MHKGQQGFTLAETMLSLGIIMIIVAMMVPALKSAVPDTDKERAKQGYFTIMKAVESMVSNSFVYPNSEVFADTSTVTLTPGNETYGGMSKFANFFKSKLNVLEDNITVTSATPVICDSDNATATCASDCNGRRIQSNCFSTNSNFTFCVPTDTTCSFKSGAPNAITIIRYYTKQNKYDDEHAYFVAVSTLGQVSVMLPERLGLRCSDNEVYEKYSQCKLNDYLTYTK